MVSCILQGVRYIGEISAAELGFKKFSDLSEVLFSYFFFHLHLFDGAHFQYFQVLVVFLFSNRSNISLIWQFNSFHCFSFSTFSFEHGIFSIANFYSYMLVVYSYCLYQNFQFFFLFCWFFPGLILEFKLTPVRVVILWLKKGVSYHPYCVVVFFGGGPPRPPKSNHPVRVITNSLFSFYVYGLASCVIFL